MQSKISTKEKKFNYWKYFAEHKVGIFFWILLMALDIAFQTFIGIYGAYILADISLGVYLVAINKLIILFIVTSISSLVSYIRGSLLNILQVKIVNKMRIDIVAQAFKISDKAYADHQTGNFTQRISGDPASIFSNLEGFISFLQQLITSSIMVIYIVFISPFIGIFAILTIGLVFIIEHFRRKILKKDRKELYKREEKSGSLLNEVIRSQKDIKSLNLEEKLKQNVQQTIKHAADQDVKSFNTSRKFSFSKNIILNLLVTSMLIIGLWRTHLGLLTISTFMVIYNNRYELNSAASVVTYFSDFLTQMSLATTRINQLFEDDEYELEKFGNKKLKNVSGKIEFKDVCFSYSEYRYKNEDEIKKEIKFNKKHKIKETVKTREEIGKKPVLENLNFVIEPHTSVAFVGVSGSGKSTILNLISKIYDANKGKVLIDGVDINKLSKETIRSSISFVNQFPYIFDMSIKENLLLAKEDATDEEVKQALSDSALLDFVNGLPNKLETLVGESGIKLSGGQKQRLAIARAMLRKSPIIIFDESTSSLDNIAQNQVKESIDKIKGKSTIIIVAHRLSTIKNVDKIFFLENGKIIDSGTFEELFKKNKTFKTMFLAENL